MDGQYKPTVEKALELFNKYFLNRTDVIGVKNEDEIFPANSESNLEKLLISHSSGCKATALRRSNGNSVTGLFKCGSYAPAPNYRTKWLCIDFDGSNHGNPLIDPKMAVLRTAIVFRQNGLIPHIECSSSGKGYHLWVFFESPVPARESRALARALSPRDLLLKSGEAADPVKNKGIEIFPKTNELKPDGLGYQVFLPFYHAAAEGGSLFYEVTAENDLKPYLPIEFELTKISKVNETLVKFGGIINIFETDRSSFKLVLKEEENNSIWKKWRHDVLQLVDLNNIYGNYLTGRKNGEAWLECHDPWSETGDQNPSAGICLGSADYERGLFHSFITGEALSVFDFIRKQKIVEDNFIAAGRYISTLVGVDFPLQNQNSPSGNSANNGQNNNNSNNNNNNNNSGPQNNNGAQAPLPMINVSNRQLREIIADAWNAVVASNNNDPRIFIKSGMLVSLNLEEKVPSINSLEQAEMFGTMIRCINWTSLSNQGVRNVTPSDKIARDMLCYDDLNKSGLPLIEFITTSPIFASNGELIVKNGYSPSAKVWFKRTDSLNNIDNVPLAPTKEEALASVKFIADELICNFPFVSQADYAHFFGALFLPFVRQLIDGPTPLHVVEAPTPGTGKGKLCNLISIIFTGSPCEACTLPNDDDSIRKMVTAELVKAKSIVLFDNIPENKRLNSPSLASLLTSQTWTDRVLGATKMTTLSNFALWLLTANNPQFSMEIARRCIRIRLDAKQDQPWKRKGFKHEYVEEWAVENRGKLVQAILTIIQYWLVNGKHLSKTRLGTYERWSAIIGGILEFIEIPGFLTNLEEMYEASDTEGKEWRLLVIKWLEQYGTNDVKLGEIIAMTDQWDIMHSIVGDGQSKVRQNRLLTALRAVRDRVIGNHKIEEVKDTGKGTFKLVQVNSADSNSQTSNSSDLTEETTETTDNAQGIVDYED